MASQIREREGGRGNPAPSRNRPKTKSGRRAAAQRAAAERAEAARRAAAARRRRTAIAAVAAAVVVVAVAVTLTLVLSHRSAGTGKANAAATASAFPSLPAGADKALRTKPTVTAGSGSPAKLVTTTLVQGNGAAVKSGQTVTVNYVGVSYATGQEFDSSWSRSQPFSFQIGAGQVIQGWDQGLVGVKVGSRVQLDIPSSMAYGDSGANGAPTGPLRFVVDVLSAS